jgi:hypothetical protein
MTQVKEPTVKTWPGLGSNGELGMHTIWPAIDQAHTPTWYANCRQKLLGSPPRGDARW